MYRKTGCIGTAGRIGIEVWNVPIISYRNAIAHNYLPMMFEYVDHVKTYGEQRRIILERLVLSPFTQSMSLITPFDGIMSPQSITPLTSLGPDKKALMHFLL